MKEYYLQQGKRGYFGTYEDPTNNEKVKEINELVDKYNTKINTFDTKKENDAFVKEISDKINSIANTIR